MLRLAAFFLSLPILVSAQNYDTSQWLKGNTHTHSLWSDGNDFPESIIAWYEDQGYDFISLSDHNILQTGEKWMDLDSIKKRQRAIGRDAVSKCEARFGKDWIQWEERDGKPGIRLKTLEQCREILKDSDKFLIVPGEEISNFARDKAPVHINAINLPHLIPAVSEKTLPVEETMRQCFLSVKEVEETTGTPILAHLNHPNFRWAITPENLANVAEGAFFEVYNGHPGINHLGDETRPGDEMAWDIANTLRIAELSQPPLFGLATDDSHTYHGGDVSPGRGWVVVGAGDLTGNAIVEAMRLGKFYSSSGVILNSINYDPDTRTLSLSIAAEEGATYSTEFIGSQTDYDAASRTGIGVTLSSQEGTEPSFSIPEGTLYLRATITSSLRHTNPSYTGQKKQAWVQPVGWRNPAN